MRTIMKYKMKRISMFLMVLTILNLGCKSTTPYFYMDNSGMNFEILGEVTFIGETTRFLGFAPIGSASFQELLKEAKKMYNADYVINVTIDCTKYYGLLVSKAIYNMRGTAIKYVGYQNLDNVTTNASILERMNAIENDNQKQNISISDNYTVINVTGNVTQRISGAWAIIKRGDIIKKETFIRTDSNSTLELSDGNVLIGIPSGKNNILENLIKEIN